MKNLKYIIISIALVLASVLTNAQTVYTVTKTTDPDPFEHPFNDIDSLCDAEMYGTLRWAINKVNSNTGESVIEFDIEGTGVQEILLNSYLPQILNDVTIDGTKQNGYLQGSPKIKINGSLLSQQSCFASYKNSINIEGIWCTNFSNNVFDFVFVRDSEIKNNMITHFDYTSKYSIVFISRECENIVFYNNIIEHEAGDPNSRYYTYGFYFKGSNNITVGGTGEEQANTITNCRTALHLEVSQQIKISGNRIYNNDFAMEFLYDSNGNIPPPEITEYNDGILYGTALPDATIEVFGSTGEENANEYLVSTVANEHGDWDVEVSRTVYEQFLVTQTDENNNTSTFSNIQFTVYIVTKTTDPDPFEHPFNNDDNLCDPEMYGTLRWAINKVNSNTGEATIAFDIAGTGVQEIILNSYLPQSRKNVTIDGTTQNGYTPNEPKIKINGQILSRESCFTADNNSINIEGIWFANFSHNVFNFGNVRDSEIKNNRITHILNTSKYSTVFGIGQCENISFYNNIIENESGDPNSRYYTYGFYFKGSNNMTVGGTEEGQGNTITNCRTALFLGDSQHIKMSGNRIFNNDYAMKFLYGSNGDIQPPTIYSYNEGILKGSALPNATIEVFGSTGEENANEYLTSVVADGNGEWSVVISTSYKYAIATQRENLNNSSVLSNLIPLIEIELLECPFEPTCNLICNPSMLCPPDGICGETHVPQNWVNAHGTCDWCSGIHEEEEQYACNALNVDNIPPPDTEFVLWFSNEANTGWYEGIMSLLSHPVMPNQDYEISFYIDYRSTEFDLIIRLVATDQVEEYLPAPYLHRQLPEIEDTPGICKTIYNSHFSGDTYEWINIIEPYPSESGDEVYDAIWIYTYADRPKNMVMIGFDQLIIERTQIQQPAEASKTCYQEGETISLMAYDPYAVSYEWSGPDGMISNVSNPQILNASEAKAGEYTVTVIDTYGCELISSVNVVVNDIYVQITSPLTTIPENEVHICPDQNLIITATATPTASQPLPYLFTWNTGYSMESYMNSFINTSLFPSMTFEVTVTDENGCSATNSFTVNHHPVPTVPEPINTGPYCIGEDIVLSVLNPNPDYQYAWSANLWSSWIIGFDEDNINVVRPNAQNNTCCQLNPYYYNSFSGTYNAIAKNEYGCTASASTYVDVIPDQSCMWLTSNSPVCDGDDLIIYFNSTGTSAFCGLSNSEIIVEGPQSFLSYEYNDGALIIHDVDVDDSGTISITVNTLNNCSTNVFEIDVSILENPEVTLPHNLSPYCMGQTITITPTHSDFIVSYTWDGPSYGSHDPVAHFTLPAGTSGELPLSLTVTDINGCTASDVTTLYVYPGNAFQVFASSNSPVCQGGSLNLNVSPSNNDYIYNWQGPNNFSSDLQNPVIDEVQLLNSGTYNVAVVQVFGTQYFCYGSASIEVLVEDCSQNFNLLCSTRPVTCDIAYNGAVIIEVSEGNPPYLAEIYRNGILLNSQNLDSDGTHIVELQGVEPDDETIVVSVIDDLGNTQQFAIVGGLNYAWDIVLSNNNLYLQNNYENMIFSIGDCANNQKLDFYDDFIFSNCTFYTTTALYNDIEMTEWDIHTDNIITFENCTIQSGCPNLMWQGINLNGTEDMQADLNTKIEFNNSTISDATVAIFANLNACVKVRNSTFLNNQYDIYLDNSINQELHTIYRNSFLTTRLLNNVLLEPESHIYLYKVPHIMFTGNTFKNSVDFNLPGYETYERGIGINSILSGITVTPINWTTYTPIVPWAINTFEGLYYGINVKSGITHSPNIIHNTFINNYRGVHITTVGGLRLLFNNFTNTIEIPPVTETIGIPVNEEPETNVSYAAYINSCTDFKVEENTIKGIQAGIYIYNAGDASGQLLYRNKFGDNPGSSTYNMYAGTLVVGKNSNWNYLAPPIIHSGLEVKCNNYTSTNYAISVMNGNMRKLQGTNSVGDDKLAGNQFRKQPLVNGIDFTVQIDANYQNFDLGMYTYWQHSNNTGIVNDYYRELSTYTVNKVDPETSPFFAFNENTCLSHYQSPLSADDELEGIMDDIAVIGSSITSTNDLYDELVDRGDKEYMKDIAEDLSPRNFQQYVPVLSNDGYLSNEVFETILDNRKAQKPVIAAVLIANSPLPVEIMEQVESSTYLSNGHKKQVRNYQSGINARVLLEYNIADLEQEKAVKESLLINNAINNDSLPEMRDIVISYLDPQSNDYNKLIKIYGLNMSKQNYSASIANLDNIRQLASMPQNETISDELIMYCDIQELFIASIQDENSLLVHKDMLLEATLDGSALYSATAQVLYEIAADTVFAEYTPLPVTVMQPRKAEVNDAITQEQFLPFINVYPNPADAEINIEYDFTALYDEGNDLLLEQLGIDRREDCVKGELCIFTEDGKLLLQFRLNAVTDSFSISIEYYTPGIYMLVVKDCYGNSKTVKITKNK
ncbi:MAG: hypothetical protein PHW83_02690 [Bacteroidales bacterium]|nr:hypothetical protein [Bacteroidales bacterium]